MARDFGKCEEWVRKYREFSSLPNNQNHFFHRHVDHILRYGHLTPLSCCRAHDHSGMKVQTKGLFRQPRTLFSSLFFHGLSDLHIANPFHIISFDKTSSLAAAFVWVNISSDRDQQNKFYCLENASPRPVEQNILF